MDIIKIVVVHSEGQNKINTKIYHSRPDFTKKIKGCLLSVPQHNKKNIHYILLNFRYRVVNSTYGTG